MQSATFNSRLVTYTSVDGRAVIDAAYTEAEWQAQVIHLARGLGWTVWHFHDSRRQVRRRNQYELVGDADAAGFPDLVLARERLVFAELKSEKGRLTKLQKQAMAVLSETGVEVYLWRPSDWNVVCEVLA